MALHPPGSFPLAVSHHSSPQRWYPTGDGCPPVRGTPATHGGSTAMDSEWKCPEPSWAPRAEQVEERAWLWPTASAAHWGNQTAPGRAAGELPPPANPAAAVDAPLYARPQKQHGRAEPRGSREEGRGSDSPPERDLVLTAGLLPAGRSIWLYNKGKAGGRCLKIRLTHPQPHERKTPPKQPPTGPAVSGRGSGFEAREQWGDLSLLSSGKGKRPPCGGVHAGEAAE